MEQECEFYCTPIGHSLPVKCRAVYIIEEKDNYYVCKLVVGTLKILEKEKEYVAAA